MNQQGITNTTIIILTIIALALVAAAFFFVDQNNIPLLPGASPSPSPTATTGQPTPPLNGTDASPSPSPTNRTDAQVPNNWQTFDRQNFSFTFSYPPDMNLDTTEIPEWGEQVNVTLQGPTQTQGTELFDGISLQIASQNLPENQTLQQFAQDQVQAEEDDPVGEVTQDLSPTTVGDYQGFRYTVEGLGTFTHYLLADENTVVRIVSLVEDPTNQGFTQTVSRIFNTLRITP